MINVKLTLQKYWNNFTYIDPRSYVCFRMGLAIALFLDLFISRFWKVEFFLSDAGVLPRKLLSDYAGFSLFFASGGVIWAYLLLCVLAISSLCIFFGYFTRLSTIVSYIILLSLHWRAEYILSGSDVLFLLLCMWSIILPLGKYGSVDSYHINGSFFPKVKQNESFNEQLGILGIIILVVCLYGVASYSKLDSKEWYGEFSTLYYVLNTGYHTTPIGYLFRNQVLLTKVFTFMTLCIEWLLPVLILMPFKTRACRLFFSLAVISMHTSFGLMLFVSNFPILGILIGILFLPTFAWNYIWNLESINKKIEDKFKYFESLTKSYKNPNFCEFKYSSTLLSIFLIYNLGVQFVVNLNEVSKWELGDSTFEIMTKYYIKTLRIDQSWIMFMNAPRWSGWPEVIVNLENGESKDIWRQEWQGISDVSRTPPKIPAMAFKNSLRLFNYFNKMSEPKANSQYYPYYAFYVCKKWSENNYIKTKSVDFYYNYTYWSEIGKSEVKDRKLAWSYNCPVFS